MPTVEQIFNEKYDLARLENMWMKLIMDAILELIETKDMCDCQDCVLDVLALSLNKLSPKYWVSGQFNAFYPPESFLADPKNQKMAADAVLKSLRQVQKNPHHD